MAVVSRSARSLHNRTEVAVLRHQLTLHLLHQPPRAARRADPPQPLGRLQSFSFGQNELRVSAAAAKRVVSTQSLGVFMNSVVNTLRFIRLAKQPVLVLDGKIHQTFFLNLFVTRVQLALLLSL